MKYATEYYAIDIERESGEGDTLLVTVERYNDGMRGVTINGICRQYWMDDYLAIRLCCLDWRYRLHRIY